MDLCSDSFCCFVVSQLFIPCCTRLPLRRSAHAFAIARTIRSSSSSVVFFVLLAFWESSAASLPLLFSRIGSPSFGVHLLVVLLVQFILAIPPPDLDHVDQQVLELSDCFPTGYIFCHPDLHGNLDRAP